VGAGTRARWVTYCYLDCPAHPGGVTRARLGHSPQALAWGSQVPTIPLDRLVKAGSGIACPPSASAWGITLFLLYNHLIIPTIDYPARPARQSRERESVPDWVTWPPALAGGRLPIDDGSKEETFEVERSILIYPLKLRLRRDYHKRITIQWHCLKR
jgi:hypothetical protein